MRLSGPILMVFSIFALLLFMFDTERYYFLVSRAIMQWEVPLGLAVVFALGLCLTCFYEFRKPNPPPDSATQ